MALIAPVQSNVELGYAEITANDTQTGAGNKDVSGLSVTITVAARPILILAGASSLSNSSASGISQFRIMESSTVLATYTISQTTLAVVPMRTVRLAPSAGSHTYKINILQFVTGNTVLGAGATDPTFIQAIQI